MTNNIATLNETAISTFALLKKEVQPYALRFEKFATATGLSRFMKMELSDDRTGDKYDVDISAPVADGVHFTFRETYYDESYTYFFTIPYAYFEDPDEWEITAQRHIEGLTKSATAAFVKIFPKFETDPTLKVLEFEIDAPFAYDAVPLAAPEFLEYSFKNGDTPQQITYFVYDGVEYNINSFSYQISTGSVLYRGHFNRSTDADMVVMTRPVTVEERAAEKAEVDAKVEEFKQELARKREERIESERQRIAESRAKKEQKKIDKQARHEENMRQKALAEARRAERANKE
jgi:hypothetical protein